MNGSDRSSAWRSAGIAGCLAVAALVLVLLLPSQLLLSSPGTDLVQNYVASRAFAARTMAAGHLPLWNPFTYAGQPFLGGFESAVLYPPNLLFLCLPLAPALNFSMLLHLIILGWGMERWAVRRGLHPWAAGLAGIVLPLSGPVFPHLYAGHLSNFCTMAWAPWIFLGFESWVRWSERRGLFLASAGVCLQILAGHVQYFFYTAVAAGLQALVLTVAEPAVRRRALPALIGCYFGGVALSAAQLLPGLDALEEGVRQRSLDYDFAAMFSFPPENFLTTIAPGFFGTLADSKFPGEIDYWGRCYLWEMSLFTGVAGPLLIAVALGGKDPKRRQVVLDLITAALLLVLALGAHTPVFNLLYYDAPGFGHFRGWSKFTFPAMLFLVMTMASGASALLRGKIPPRTIGWGGIIAGMVMIVGAGIFLFAPESIAPFFSLVAGSHESYLPPEFFTQPGNLQAAGWHAGLSLGLAGLILTLAATTLLFLKRQPLLRWALPVILILEMMGFTSGQVAVAHLSDAMPDPLRRFVAAHPGDYRVLDLTCPNNGFLLGASNLDGFNPTGLRRYTEFMFYTQGADPDHATQYIHFRGLDPLYAMLRLRYAFVPGQNGVQVVESKPAPLPRLLLLSDCKILRGRDAIFSALRDPSFNPGKTVLLENDPEPSPEPGATGTVKLISEQPDELVIEADAGKPLLLLITDLYDHNWGAEALPGSVQTSYQLLPADYILRAVPLAAGHHRLRIVYAPAAFSIGAGVSAVAWLIWAGLLVWLERGGEFPPLISSRPRVSRSPDPRR
ncbi:MAG TPA: hypothetical protein VL981_00315 [Candidatus Methylacidiphilales bacterium]|nr:hypothetical protein [Candidatus Methylacidiphilales bacterium]